MKNTVIIKGNRYGISIVLDKDLEFEELLKDLADKLEGAEKFFDSSRQLAVTFEGRTLANEEMDQILGVIKDNSKLNIQYVMDENSELEATFYDIIHSDDVLETTKELPVKQSEFLEEKEEILPIPQEIPESAKTTKEANGDGLFYKGTLRSGQTLETKGSLVIIGDVNPGATVIAEGNIIIIGALKGSVSAGANGNRNAFVIALYMEPIQIQIADIIARSSDKKKFHKRKKETMIATVVENQICIEAASKTAIHEIYY